MDTRPEATGGELIFVDRVLWSQLASAKSAPEFCKAWLALQCSMISGVVCAAVVFKDTDATEYEPVAFWPTREALQASVISLAEEALLTSTNLCIDVADLDGDANQSDFAIPQRCYSGENVPGDPNCAG